MHSWRFTTNFVYYNEEILVSLLPRHPIACAENMVLVYPMPQVRSLHIGYEYDTGAVHVLPSSSYRRFVGGMLQGIYTWSPPCGLWTWMVSPMRVVNNVSPFGVVDVVSPLSVVDMVGCQTPSVTANIHLAWCGWWVVDLKSSPPPLGMEHPLAGLWIVTLWKLRHPLARVV